MTKQNPLELETMLEVRDILVVWYESGDFPLFLHVVASPENAEKLIACDGKYINGCDDYEACDWMWDFLTEGNNGYIRFPKLKAAPKDVQWDAILTMGFL